MENALNLLRRCVDRIYPLNESDWDAFAGIWKTSTATRMAILTSKGEIENHLYFITEGVQRVYFSDESGKEATLVFSYAGSFGGVLDSFMCNRPSPYYYQALTSSCYLYTSRAKLKEVMNNRPEINQMIIIGISNAMSGLLERLVETQCFSSQEKFHSLLSRSPHILNLIPHKYLANYIGIDPTNFSKFLNSVQI